MTGTYLYELNFGYNVLSCEVSVTNQNKDWPEVQGVVTHIRKQVGFGWMVVGLLSHFETSMLTEIKDPNEIMKDNL